MRRGVCVFEGCGRGKGACLAGEGGMHGGCAWWDHAWQGACIVGGMYGMGHAWQEACIAGGCGRGHAC